MVTWVHDITEVILDRNTNAQIIFATGLPHPGKEKLDQIAYNRNVAYAIRRWNVVNPTKFVKYCGWHKILVSLMCPADGAAWDRSEIAQVRQEFMQVARLEQDK